MDSIRQALGLKQISYYGFSYGTYLGQVYSTLFPSHVRRLIMDSNVDPRKVWYQANLDQDVAFERNINIWFGWLAKYDSVYHLGATRQAVVAPVLQDPVRAGGQPDRRRRRSRRVERHLPRAGLLPADLAGSGGRLAVENLTALQKEFITNKCLETCLVLKSPFPYLFVAQAIPPTNTFFVAVTLPTGVGLSLFPRNSANGPLLSQAFRKPTSVALDNSFPTGCTLLSVFFSSHHMGPTR